MSLPMINQFEIILVSQYWGAMLEQDWFSMKKQCVFGEWSGGDAVTTSFANLKMADRGCRILQGFPDFRLNYGVCRHVWHLRWSGS
jgi:hypothetical protein